MLQLSGQNPLIVAGDADLEYAVDAATFGAFVHQGQVCMCARRIYVERPLAEAFAERFAARVAALPTGDPADPATVLTDVPDEAEIAQGRRSGPWWCLSRSSRPSRPSPAPTPPTSGSSPRSSPATAAAA
ncbi:aldehyde dehydrogenase family protein [Nonomuraea rubra]|uniref:aldehyde dehydrogenase family protein n=1 Tax=Nonomuraea rubra TaxID=46180 RepID=UPI00360F9FAB